AYSEAARSAVRRVAEPAMDFSALTPDQIIRRIKKLEQEMLRHARNLEFEQAARLRDEIQQLRNAAFGLPPTTATADTAAEAQATSTSARAGRGRAARGGEELPARRSGVGKRSRARG